jgi:hypothetical protein
MDRWGGGGGRGVSRTKLWFICRLQAPGLFGLCPYLFGHCLLAITPLIFHSSCKGPYLSATTACCHQSVHFSLVICVALLCTLHYLVKRCLAMKTTKKAMMMLCMVLKRKHSLLVRIADYKRIYRKRNSYCQWMFH